MLKRHFAVLLTAGLVLGGGAFAWAQTADQRPTLDAAAETAVPPGPDAAAKRAQMKACVEAARAAQGASGDRVALKAAVQKCAADAGITGRKGRKAPKAGVLGRVVHGDLVVRNKDGGFENLTYDRGQLESASGSTITLKRPDGVVVSATLTDATKYRGVASAADLKTGDPVVVVTKDHSAVTVLQKGAGPKPAGGPKARVTAETSTEADLGAGDPIDALLLAP